MTGYDQPPSQFTGGQSGIAALTQAPVSEVPMLLEAQEKEIHGLADTVDQLLQRLDPALRLQPPGIGQATSPQPGHGSKLAEMISGRTTGIRVVRNRLADALARLDI